MFKIDIEGTAHLDHIERAKTIVLTMFDIEEAKRNTLSTSGLEETMQIRLDALNEAAATHQFDCVQLILDLKIRELRLRNKIDTTALPSMKEIDEQEAQRKKEEEEMYDARINTNVNRFHAKFDSLKLDQQMKIRRTMFMSIQYDLKKVALLLLCASLCSCASISDIVNNVKTLPNSCMIDAVNIQSANATKTALSKDLFSEILIVGYIDKNKLAQVKHAFCVYNDMNGNLYAQDFRGAKELKTGILEPMELARQLVEMPVQAYWK